MNGASLNNGNITGVNKITVATIDPLYQIGTSKYASYAPSVVGGVKEEFVGKAKLSLVKHEAGIMYYEYVLDFSKMNNGSDLWVWRKTVEFSDDNVEVTATPQKFSVPIAYEIKGEKVVFRSSVPDSYFELPASISFSFRLTGKRFDWKKWPTLATDQSERPSFIIK
jgi:hypothetical protein